MPRCHQVQRIGHLAGGGRLGQVAGSTGPDDRHHVLGGVGDRQRQEANPGVGAVHLLDYPVAAAAGQVHVEEHYVGNPLPDQLDGRVHVVRLADHLHGGPNGGSHPGPEQVVVVHDEDPQPGLSHRRSRGEGRSPCPLPGWSGSPPSHPRAPPARLPTRPAPAPCRRGPDRSRSRGRAP